MVGSFAFCMILGRALLGQGLVGQLLIGRLLIGQRAANWSTEAEHSLKTGHADEATAQLRSELQREPQNPLAHNLLCRVEYQERRWEDAVSDCEAAEREEPGNSLYHLWLGRAYGQKADTVNLIAAYKLGKKVQSEFATAITLDPNSTDALADMGEFDIEAPALLGGGLTRAEQVASALQKVDPGRHHWLLARIAESRGKYDAAEREFRAAITQSNHPAQAWMDLASFYRRRDRVDDMERAVSEGAKADADASSALVDGAALLERTQRNRPLAIDLLRRYLASSNQSEDTPAFAVRAQLGHLLQASGDSPGAAAQFAQASTLARDFVLDTNAIDSAAERAAKRKAADTAPSAPPTAK